jgi:UPF0042 nucleotide-binding protein
MRLLIITGLSGSGKTSVVHALEDMGFFCVENMPVQLLPVLLDYLAQWEKPIAGFAVVVDIRERLFLEKYQAIFREIEERGIATEIFFLEATTQVLLRRFEETRRRHPLAGERTLLDGIECEMDQLSGLRQVADRVIDTSSFNIHQLRQYINLICGAPEGKEKRLQIELVSFSYAEGVPVYADLIMDVRFLPNPHYDPALKERDGRDPEVQRYIRGNRRSTEILQEFFHLFESMISFYETEDRIYLVLAVGCTGGKHRSVAIVCALEERLRSLGYAPKVLHRDIHVEKGSFRFG